MPSWLKSGGVLLPPYMTSANAAVGMTSLLLGGGDSLDLLHGLLLHPLSGHREGHLTRIVVKKFSGCLRFSFLGSLDREQALGDFFFLILHHFQFASFFRSKVGNMRYKANGN